jgi:hypothetical protein
MHAHMYTGTSEHSKPEHTDSTSTSKTKTKKKPKDKKIDSEIVQAVGTARMSRPAWLQDEEDDDDELSKSESAHAAMLLMQGLSLSPGKRAKNKPKKKKGKDPMNEEPESNGMETLHQGRQVHANTQSSTQNSHAYREAHQASNGHLDVIDRAKKNASEQPETLPAKEEENGGHLDEVLSFLPWLREALVPGAEVGSNEVVGTPAQDLQDAMCSNSPGECVVCWDRASAWCIVPCGHQV